MPSVRKKQQRLKLRQWLSPLLVFGLLIANIVAPLSMQSAGVQAAGLDDSNSVVICTPFGLKRVALDDLGSNSERPADTGGHYSFCPICAFAAVASHVPPAGVELPALEFAKYMPRFPARSRNVTQHTEWRLNHPRAPPELS